MPDQLLDLPVTTLKGEVQRLGDFGGSLWLLVNTASQCGFTPQYAALEALWQRYGERGLRVLGFPCNQFGHQEPGDAETIGAFCERNYGVSFVLSRKIEVNGPGTDPLFAALKRRAPGLLGSQAIKWNFTKFLVADEGREVLRFAPTTAPEKLAELIEARLP